jgi:hypothetical protein
MSMSALKKTAPPGFPGPPGRLQTWATVPLSRTKSPGSLAMALAAVQFLVSARRRATAGEPTIVPYELVVPPRPPLQPPDDPPSVDEPPSCDAPPLDPEPLEDDPEPDDDPELDDDVEPLDELPPCPASSDEPELPPLDEGPPEVASWPDELHAG